MRNIFKGKLQKKKKIVLYFSVYTYWINTEKSSAGQRALIIAMEL